MKAGRCRHKSRVLFVSNNASLIKRRLLTMTLSDGTGMDVGTAVGFKVLPPALRSRFRAGGSSGVPAPFGTGVCKVTVIITDGELTRQAWPVEGRNWAEAGTACRTVLGLMVEEQNRFERLCDDMKAEEIALYTIGFQGDPARWSDGALRARSQSLSQYFRVAGLDIAAAFSSIASSINGIRITE